MSFEDREKWAELSKALDHPDDEDYHAMHTIPPGEEAMFLSHEGGDDELCQAIFDEPKR